MKKNLGDRLRDLRGNESQTAFCLKIEQKQGTYSAWERNEKDPSSSAIALICKATGVSADWLLGLDDAPSVPAVKSLETHEGESYWKGLCLKQQETISKLTAMLAEGRASDAGSVRAGGRTATKTA
jgi:transcriptional regulator with XRE-family HTH domain